MIWLREMRVSHYLKNGLIFIPLIFGGQVFCLSKFLDVFVLFLAFCLMASSVYIINDIVDVEKDKLHATKKKRPIASGAISIPIAKRGAAILAVSSLCINLLSYPISPGGGIFVGSTLTLIIYLGVNVIYSVWHLKDIPLLDVILLTLGFYLRVLAGALKIHIEISDWLYLVTITGALYLGFGKRKKEMLKNGSTTRSVLGKYNINYLEKSQNMSMTLAIVFFSFWCMEKSDGMESGNFLVLVPILIIICLKYNLSLECDGCDGDPISVIYGDKVLLGLIGMLAVIIFYFMYGV